MLFSEDGRIGTLSGKGNFGLMTFVHDTGELLYFGDAVQILHQMLQLMPNSIWCKVLDVTPLSKEEKTRNTLCFLWNLKYLKNCKRE